MKKLELSEDIIRSMMVSDLSTFFGDCIQYEVPMYAKKIGKDLRELIREDYIDPKILELREKCLDFAYKTVYDYILEQEQKGEDVEAYKNVYKKLVEDREKLFPRPL